MNTAILRCGTLLTFESRTSVPAVGDVVPCRHHGFCVVESASDGGGPWSRRSGRARPRAQWELEEWLEHRPSTTVHALRRQRFTLRMVAAAERDGLVDVDLLTGKVVTRFAGAVRRAAAGADDSA
jgi:hypothetical protein